MTNRNRSRIAIRSRWISLGTRSLRKHLGVLPEWLFFNSSHNHAPKSPSAITGFHGQPQFRKGRQWSCRPFGKASPTLAASLINCLNVTPLSMIIRFKDMVLFENKKLSKWFRYLVLVSNPSWDAVGETRCWLHFSEAG